jgi:adenosine deaminase
MTNLRESPKVELHCHLIGLIEPFLLAQIQENRGKVLVESEILQKVYPVSGLAGFTRWLEVLKPYQMATPELMRPFLAAHVSQLISQRVVYAEIMLSPTMFPREPAERLRAFQRWRNWTLELEQEKIQIEYLVVIPRSLADGLIEHDTAAFLELFQAGLIVGVALVGVENGESLQRFSRSFARWREAGLGIEIHAGEHGGSEVVRDALVHGSPHRLGHALSIFHDLALVEEVKRRGVHLEFCLTSNLRTGAVTDFLSHPIRWAREWGMSYSINTDDPGAFECSLESEFRLLRDQMQFTDADFGNVYRNSLAARFQPKLRYLPDVERSGPSRQMTAADG